MGVSFRKPHIFNDEGYENAGKSDNYNPEQNSGYKFKSHDGSLSMGPVEVTS